MTDQKKDAKKDPMQAEFEALPLDQKFSKLLQMEAVTITEAFNYVVEHTSKAFEKAGAAINDFGPKFEQEVTKAAEAATGKKAGEAPKSTSSKSKTRTSKKAPGSDQAV